MEIITNLFMELEEDSLYRRDTELYHIPIRFYIILYTPFYKTQLLVYLLYMCMNFSIRPNLCLVISPYFVT